MKVTLVYCAIGIAGFNADRPLGDREGSVIGHGIASIGASTKKVGHEVDLIDLRQLSGWEEFGEKVKANPANVYGISVAPVDAPYIVQCCYQIKRNAPDAKIIVGGIHPSIFPESYNYQNIDTVVIGEGEITFPRLLEDIDNLPRVIKGEKPDLNKIPWVDRELFDYRRELSCNFAPGHIRSVTMIAGRGCPYQCSYCQPAENAVFGKPFRIRDPWDVVQELEYLYEKYQYHSITFWDDTFTFSREFVMQFCGLFSESKAYNHGRPEIIICSRADIICNKPDMIKSLAEIGVNWIVIGLETGSQRLLDFIRKGTTVEQNIRSVEICKQYGINVYATIMLGLPTETKEETQMTVDMINKSLPTFVSPFWYVPIPGTGLYNFCDDNDLILNKKDTISRTGHYRPTIRGIDYQYLRSVMNDKGVEVY